VVVQAQPGVIVLACQPDPLLTAPGGHREAGAA
jgi:hypothetical protein